MGKKRALITGASRGLGLALAKKLLSEGYEVFGTSRNISHCPKIDNLNYLCFDLNDPNSANIIFEELPEIDLIISNAGESQIGSIEETTSDRIREIFEVNVFNQITLVQKYIPGMRERKNGTIINITSMAGTTPVPHSSMYASAKAAMDAFSKGLRHELKPYGIKVIAVAPFQMQTSLPQTKDYRENSPYLDAILLVKKNRDLLLSQAFSPDEIANQIISIIHQKNPPAHVSVGKRSIVKEFLVRHLPKKMVENIVRKKFGLTS
jgi:short-subunit dehydrogenase